MFRADQSIRTAKGEIVKLNDCARLKNAKRQSFVYGLVVTRQDWDSSIVSLIVVNDV